MTDLHNDFILHLNKEECEVYLENAYNQGITCIYASIWTTELKEPVNDILAAVDKIKDLKTKVELKVHIEDLSFIKNTSILLLAEEMIFPHISSAGLTWNYNNSLAGGAMEDGDLTKLGKMVLLKLFKNNIQIDLAHLNRKSFFSVFKFFREQELKFSKNQIFCSHTCFNQVKRHKRNITKKQIEMLIKNDGEIGLTLVPFFITRRKTASKNDVIKQINYFKNNFNIKYLKIGSDYFGSPQIEGLEDYKKLTRFWNKNIKCF